MAQKFNAYAALIYVTDTEEQGVMRIFGWKKKYFEGDRQLYYEATAAHDGRTVLITSVLPDRCKDLTDKITN